MNIYMHMNIDYFYHDYTMIILELSEAYRELDILKNKQIEEIDGKVIK